MLAFSIKGCIYQVQAAHKASNDKGRIRINFLKMAGASMRIMRGTLPETRLPGAIQGIDLDKQLIFAGYNSYKSGEDPFYRGENGTVFIPSVKQLIARLMSGN